MSTSGEEGSDEGNSGGEEGPPFEGQPMFKGDFRGEYSEDDSNNE